MLVEDGDSILKYLRRVSHSEIKFGGGIQSQEQIAFNELSREAVHLLVPPASAIEVIESERFVCVYVCALIAVTSQNDMIWTKGLSKCPTLEVCECWGVFIHFKFLTV